MGGKSSKANNKFIDKSLQESAKVRAYQGPKQYDRSNVPRSRSPVAPAWGNHSQPSLRGKDRRQYDRPKELETSWGKTSFNTFDLHPYAKSPSSQSYNDLNRRENYHKFSDFQNITDKREEKIKREKEKQDNEPRKKPKSTVSSPKKSFSSHDGSSKSNRRNSLPFEKRENTHSLNKKPFSKSSPQKKRLGIQPSKSAERRISDVSTLSLSENVIPPDSTFKSIRLQKNNNYGGSRSSKAAVSVYSKNTNNNYSSNQRYRDKPVERRINTPPKVHPETLKTNTQNRRQPAAFSRINSLTIGSR